MIELLSKSLESIINKEVRKATRHLHPSAFEDNADGNETGQPGGPLGFGGGNVTKLLLNKVDKTDLADQLKGKSNKTDIEMVMRQI
jgi:hypothetical protein